MRSRRLEWAPLRNSLRLWLFSAAIAVMVAVPIRVAAHTGESWSQFQGGPTHAAFEQDSPEPPYETAWTYQPGGDETAGLSTPVVVGHIAAAITSKTVIALDLESGEELWSEPRVEGPITPPATGVLGLRRVIVFTEGEGEETVLAAMDLDERKRLWKSPIGAHANGVTVEGDVVAVGMEDGTLSAFELESGNKRWDLDAGNGAIRTPPAAANGVVYAAVGNGTAGESAIVAVDMATGEKRWSFDPGLGALPSGLTLAEGRVVAGFFDQTVRSLDASNGAEQWQVRIRAPVWFLSSPAAAQGDFLVADISGGLYKLDGGSGRREWDFQFNPSGSGAVQGAPAVSGGYVLLGLQDGRIAAVDLDAGHQVWETSTGSGGVFPFALSPEAVLAAKQGGRGARGGLIALRHDPAGSLSQIESPSKLEFGRALVAYAEAFALVFAVFFLLFRVAGSRILPERPDGEDEEMDVTE